MSTITNIYGERLFIYNYHLFLKLSFSLFQKEYSFNPINEYGKFTGLLSQNLKNKNLKERKEIEDKLDKNLNICYECLSRDVVYVPVCFSLISMYPNSVAFEKIIKNILKILIKPKEDVESIRKLGSKNIESHDESGLALALEQLLTHVMYEVPLPKIESSLFLYLPHNEEQIQINNIVHKSFPIINYNIMLLLDYFSIENIININYLILSEQKLVFIADNGEYDVLFKIIEAYISLIYPLKWENTCIPCLSWEFGKYLQSFMPYIMGIEASCMNWVKSYVNGETVYMIDINSNTIDACLQDGSVMKINLSELK
jgi:hypothetical protein